MTEDTVRWRTKTASSFLQGSKRAALHADNPVNALRKVWLAGYEV